MKKHSKKYVEVSKNVESNKLYTKEEAINLVKTTSVTSFDSTVEVAIKLNIDAKKTDQQLRGSLVMPNGTGKSKRVLVIAKGAFAEEARNALSAEKIASEIFTYTDSNGTLFYRVRVGPYTTKSEAEYWQSRIALIDKFSSSKTYITDSSAKKQ